MRIQAKRFWQIAILVALAVAPVACGDDGGNGDEGPPGPPAGEGDTTGDGDADSDAGANNDGGVEVCPEPTTSVEFLNRCAKPSIQRVKFDNATRLPPGPLPQL